MGWGGRLLLASKESGEGCSSASYCGQGVPLRIENNPIQNADGWRKRPARESAKEDDLPEKKKVTHKLAQLLPKLNTSLLCHTSEILNEFLFQSVGWVFCLFSRLSGRGRMCHGQLSVVHSAS